MSNHSLVLKELSVGSIMTDPTDQVLKDLEVARAKFNKAKEAVLNAAKGNCPLAILMMLLVQQSDARLGFTATETMGVSNALLKTWHGFSEQTAHLATLTPLQKGTVLHPTDASGAPQPPGGLKVEKINDDGTLSCTDMNGQTVDFDPVDASGMLKPGLDMIDISGPFVNVRLINEKGGAVSPIDDNPFDAGNRKFAPKGAPAGVNFANKMIKAGYLGTKDLKTKVLDYIQDLRKTGGIVDQLKGYGVDVSSIQSVLTDFDNQLAGTNNLSFTVGASSSKYPDVLQSAILDCQGFKNGFTSAKDVTEAAYRSSATQFQMDLNNAMGMNSSIMQSIGAGLGSLYANGNNILANMNR
ncbi:MAG: hypothetical protein ACOYK9_05690 [Chlamydiia bacterium]